MSPWQLAAVIVVGTLAFVATLLFVIFSAVRRATERMAAELATEGIVLDSGSVPMKVRFRNFRGPGVAIGVGTRSGRGRVVLTQRRLRFLPMAPERYGFASVDRAMLSRFQVVIDGGRLLLRTDDPPNASGSVEVRLGVADPSAWRDALVEAGAKRA